MLCSWSISYFQTSLISLSVVMKIDTGTFVEAMMRGEVVRVIKEVVNISIGTNQQSIFFFGWRHNEARQRKIQSSFVQQLSIDELKHETDSACKRDLHDGDTEHSCVTDWRLRAGAEAQTDTVACTAIEVER